MAANKPATVIQIAVLKDDWLAVLCNDGTIWKQVPVSNGWDWVQVSTSEAEHRKKYNLP